MCGILKLVALVLMTSVYTDSKKHTINIARDGRQFIHLTGFGFSNEGYLFVNVTQLRKPTKHGTYWLTLDMTQRRLSQMFPPGNDKAADFCKNIPNSLDPLVIFSLDFEKKIVEVRRYGEALKKLLITMNPSHSSQVNQSNSLFLNETRSDNEDSDPSNFTNLVMYSTDGIVFSFHFTVKVRYDHEVGLYTLTFHDCDPTLKGVNLTVYMEERNKDNYLAVGDMPLPILYFSLSFIYIALGSLWLYILCKSKEEVFKIHYLMLSLMYIKSVSLLFHGINYRFIQTRGEQEEAFAILFYIIYLMKGILMFVTIILIGAGWTFIKHILSEKEKKIFAIVIPLQILTNVAHIIMFETEEGQTTYNIWNNIFILVDLVCCGAVLFPVIWSIRHLQEPSSLSDKAAINLKKLKIFRHFYIMVVFYIYFTRIIILMLNYTIPFRYTWLDELLVELATLSFFVMTGYKFRPASNNPYLQVSQSDDETEVEILTRSEALGTVTRVNYKPKKSQHEKPLLQEQE